MYDRFAGGLVVPFLLQGFAALFSNNDIGGSVQLGRRNRQLRGVSSEAEVENTKPGTLCGLCAAVHAHAHADSTTFFLFSTRSRPTVLSTSMRFF